MRHFLPVRKPLGWLCGLLLAGSAPAAQGAEIEFPPLLAAPLPDPFVLHEEGWWTVVGTSAPYFYEGPSLDRMRQRPIEVIVPPELDPHPYQTWSPSFYRHDDGQLYGLATLHYGHFRTVVGYLLPLELSAPGEPLPGSWRVGGVLAGSLAEGRTQAYDPKFYRDPDSGELFLIYADATGEHEDVHLMAQRMRTPTESDPEWQARPILSPEGYRSEDRNPGYKQIVEGGHLHRVGERWLLLYSVGDFVQNNYKIGAAWCDTMIPPPGQTYRKVRRPDPGNVWGNEGRDDEILYLLQSERPEWPNYCRPWVQGPGIGNLIRTGQGPQLVFHGYLPTDRFRDPSYRFVWRLALDLDPAAADPARRLQVRLPATPRQNPTIKEEQ